MAITHFLISSFARFYEIFFHLPLDIQTFPAGQICLFIIYFQVVFEILSFSATIQDYYLVFDR